MKGFSVGMKWCFSGSAQVGVFISAALDEQVRSQFPATKSCLRLSDPLAEASPQLSADVCTVCVYSLYARAVCYMYVCMYVRLALLLHLIWKH